jgi:hypothetical protein
MERLAAHGDGQEQLLTWKRQTQNRRSPEWLQRHGVCADHVHMRVSTLDQAGHGAFASRFLRQGTPIVPIPLLPAMDRNVMTMTYYDPQYNTDDKVSRGGRQQQQLLLNYCLGHVDSTVLLCPYGPMFSVVNHNQTLANVRLQWAVPERSNHHPGLLQLTIPQLAMATLSSESSAKSLAMELIAMRDIAPGEELFLDYGDEWEAAWKHHVESWKPLDDDDSAYYLSADYFNRQPDRLKTKMEQLSDPYPRNVALKFDIGFDNDSVSEWKRILKEQGNLDSFPKSGYLVDCEILRYKEQKNTYGRRIHYTLVIPPNDADRKTHRLVKEAPREAFVFEDSPYTTDMFLSNAFRHDIRIPDAIFPTKWKNLL